MASLLTSPSFSTMSRTLSANQTVSSSFSSTPNTFAMMGIWLRFAFRSPRSILLYIGVSISNATQRWRWKSPCSSLNCFIFCPNTFNFLFFYELESFFSELFYELMPFSFELAPFFSESKGCSSSRAILFSIFMICFLFSAGMIYLCVALCYYSFSFASISSIVGMTPSNFSGKNFSKSYSEMAMGWLLDSKAY